MSGTILDVKHLNYTLDFILKSCYNYSVKKSRRYPEMYYYEICNQRGLWVVWKWDFHYHAERVKSFKTKAGAENWAAKQWVTVIWR